MRALMKVGFSLLVLAFVLIGLSYSMLRAQGVSGPANPEGRVVESEKRSLGAGIRAVDLVGPIDLTLRQGADPSLLVRGEQRLLSKVETTQDGATLHIGTRGMLLLHRQPLQVVLVLPSLENLNIHGSGDTTVNGFSGERIDVQLDGSGSIKFSGRYKDVRAALRGSGEIDMNGGNSDRVNVQLVGTGDLTVVGATGELKAEQTGSGDLNAQHLAAEQVSVELRGSGSALVRASKRVAVNLRGSGDVTVYGNPDQRQLDTNGSGEVSFRQ